MSEPTREEPLARIDPEATKDSGIALTTLQNKLVLEISHAIVEREKLGSMLNLCCETIVQVLDAAFARVWTYNAKTDVLELQASAGLYTHIDGNHSRIPVGAFKIGRIAQACAPHLTNDVQHDPEVSDRDWAVRERMIAFAGHPLMLKTRLMGVMAVFSRSPFSEDTLTHLATIASLVAHGIDRRWREEERVHLQAKTEAALKAAERSNEALQRFAAIASHDLQEPVRQVTAFSQLLNGHCKDRLDEKAREYMAFIIEGANRMGRLIHGLLAYSQIEAMTTTPREMANTETAFLEALQNLSLASSEAGALITHDPLPIIHGNQQQLAQLFLNLLGNALKYRTATPRIHVGAVQKETEWVFSVRDNGPGVPEQYRDSIFGVFVRLHGREVSGVGLGLAFCKKIVELHEGSIWVDENADPGGGSVFCFALPN